MIKIIDDVIPKQYQDEIEQVTMNSDENDFRYHYNRDVTYANNENTTGVDNPGFNHLLYNFERNYYSNWYNLFVPLYYMAADKLGKVVAHTYQTRVFLQAPGPTSGHNHPHTDLDVPHTVMLYYINDADGDTVLFNEDGSIMQTVTPKKGRMVIFDGSIMHASGKNTKKTRVILNSDVVLKDK